MGKEHLKNISPSRLYSPWQLADNESKNNTGFSMLDTGIMNDDMIKTVLQIEKEQQARIERNREEEGNEEKYLLKLANKLDIHSSTFNSNQQELQDVQIHISSSDLAMADIFSVPKEEQSNLVTLEEYVVERGQHSNRNIEHSLSITDPQVKKVYTKIGEHLGNYHSGGRLPKTFKIIPSLTNWDEILLLTKPLLWTPQATFEATRVFLTNIKAIQIKQFLELVLLPNIRSALLNSKQLPSPLYLSLQRAILKCPAFFIKGFLFPLCESNSCTVLEASVVAQVIHACHIPVLHSATALLKLSDLPFTLPTSILVLVFLEKKQALPCRVVDSLVVKYFASCQTMGSTIAMPQIWFHSLYFFIKNYGIDLVPTQERKLLELIQTIKPDDLSKLIEESITIKGSDDDNDSENNYNTDTMVE